MVSHESKIYFSKNSHEALLFRNFFSMKKHDHAKSVLHEYVAVRRRQGISLPGMKVYHDISGCPELPVHHIKVIFCGLECNMSAHGKRNEVVRQCCHNICVYITSLCDDGKDVQQTTDNISDDKSDIIKLQQCKGIACSFNDGVIISLNSSQNSIVHGLCLKYCLSSPIFRFCGSGVRCTFSLMAKPDITLIGSDVDSILSQLTSDPPPFTILPNYGLTIAYLLKISGVEIQVYDSPSRVDCDQFFISKPPFVGINFESVDGEICMMQVSNNNRVMTLRIDNENIPGYMIACLLRTKVIGCSITAYEYMFLSQFGIIIYDLEDELNGDRHIECYRGLARSISEILGEVVIKENISDNQWYKYNSADMLADPSFIEYTACDAFGVYFAYKMLLSK